MKYILGISSVLYEHTKRTYALTDLKPESWEFLYLSSEFGVLPVCQEYAVFVLEGFFLNWTVCITTIHQLDSEVFAGGSIVESSGFTRSLATVTVV